jgi:prevent-host-death family protein
MEVNVREAKTHLFRLIERASAGEEVIIAKAGKPMKLVPIKRTPKKQVLGNGQRRFRRF